MHAHQWGVCDRVNGGGECLPQLGHRVGRHHLSRPEAVISRGAARCIRWRQDDIVVPIDIINRQRCVAREAAAADMATHDVRDG